jgi:YegS/Rv2252/BmrU family lipid kinase
VSPLDEATRTRQKADLQDWIQRERRAAIIINTQSRQGEKLHAEAVRRLSEAGLHLEAQYPIRDASRVPEVVAHTLSQGHRFVIVGGGDGTISSVVDLFAYKDVAFGLLPLGTANSFARTLSIPLDLAGAVHVLTSGKVVDVDLGQIDGDYFANAASIGLPATIARARPHLLKKVLGRAGYLVVAGARLATFKPFGCTVAFGDGSTKAFDAVVEVRIANGPYKGGLLVAEEAGLESRKLVLHIVKGGSRRRLAAVWAKLAAGMRPNASELESFTAGSFVIGADPKQYVSIDGEAVAQTPIEVKVAKQALRIVVPRERADLS